MDVLRECRPEEGASQPTMEVLVETLTGTAFEMTVSPSDTIFAIKSKIFRVEGIPISQQHLLYNLKELEDSSSLRELAIGDGARLRLVLGMRGGPVSTRRLPPPAPHAQSWPELDHLLHSTREESDCGGGGGGGGCKVTVLVFRDGERVNMLRVRENRDGSYSPLEHNRCFSDSVGSEETCGGGAAENAVTHNKMLEIKRRMELLSLQRQTDRTGSKVEIQKTRSEETLPAASLGARADVPLYARARARPRAPRLTLPPLLASAPSHEEPAELPLGSGLVLGRAEPRALQPVAAADEDCDCGTAGWGPGFSSSTSDLELLKRNSGRLLPALSRHRPREHLHLSDEHLARAPPPRAPPPPPAPPAPPAPAPATTSVPDPSPPRRARCSLCRRRLSCCATHVCRCGGAFCAPHRYAEVHGCRYDYKAAPPRPAHVRPPKLPEI